jgi:hypothetical protein
METILGKDGITPEMLKSQQERMGPIHGEADAGHFEGCAFGVDQAK